MLPRDSDTRWKSWLTMLEVVIELQNHIRVFIDRNFNAMQHNYINNDERATLIEMKGILQPFRDSTQYLESDHITLDQVLWTNDFLIHHISIKQQQYARDPRLSAQLYTMWFSFDKYYALTYKTPAYVAALLLNQNTTSNILMRSGRLLR
jgi:hypothetical protein